MVLTFPGDCTTPADRTEYCYRAQELLRLDRNAKSEDFKEEKISESEWRTYLTNIFEPKQETIVTEILKQRALLKASTEWIIDIGTI